MAHTWIAPKSLLDALGGWTNLFQGLGSGVIGGLVAALTAYLVVRWTHGKNMELASEVDARTAVRGLMTDASKVLTDLHEMANRSWDSREEKLDTANYEVRLARMHFATAINLTFPPVRLVDKEFHDEIARRSKRIDEAFSEIESRIRAAQLDEEDEHVFAAIVESLEASSIQMNDLLRKGAVWSAARTEQPKRRVMERLKSRKKPSEVSQPPTEEQLPKTKD